MASVHTRSWDELSLLCCQKPSERQNTPLLKEPCGLLRGQGQAWPSHLQDGHSLGEVVLLHSGRGVEGSQGVIELLQVGVTEAPVVQVMTETRDQQPFALENKTVHRCSKPSNRTRGDVQRACRSCHTDVCR